MQKQAGHMSQVALQKNLQLQGENIGNASVK